MSRIFTKQKKSSINSSTSENKIKSELSRIENKSIFDTVIVTDYVANPEEFLNQTIDFPDIALFKGTSGKSNLKNQFQGSSNASRSSKINYRTYLKSGPQRVKNPDLIDIMPRNSIIAINISKNKNLKSLDEKEVFFPFFSHLSLPVKSGEQIWVFYDNVQGRKVGYWISRKVGSLFVEDLNYTHLDRQVLINAALVSNLGSKSAVKTKKVNDLGASFPNPAINGGNIGTLTTQTYDHLILRSFSHKKEREEFIGEPVPRYSKKCADLVLQGSNNTLITMTHEGSLSTGTIKLVTGRKNIPSILKNKRKLAKEFEHEEIDKLTALRGEIPDITEGSLDSKAAASLTLTENFGGMIELMNADNSFIKIMPNDSEELEVDGGVVLQAAEGKLIRLGGMEAEESAVLGDTLASILSDLINNLLTISLATGVGPTGPLSASVDGGGAQISQLLSRIDSIKSLTTKVK